MSATSSKLGPFVQQKTFFAMLPAVARLSSWLQMLTTQHEKTADMNCGLLPIG
jgi:hypothetical protein